VQEGVRQGTGRLAQVILSVRLSPNDPAHCPQRHDARTGDGEGGEGLGQIGRGRPQVRRRELSCDDLPIDFDVARPTGGRLLSQGCLTRPPTIEIGLRELADGRLAVAG
jgi:hypothetical protein